MFKSTIAVGLISLNILLIQQLTTQAQSVKQNSKCAATLQSVKHKITKGRRVKVVEISKDNISKWYYSYPNNRPLSYFFILQGAATDSILASDKFMTSITREVITNCQKVSNVSFGKYRTDYIMHYGLMPGNKIQEFKCIPPGTNQKLNWGYAICP
jgi:hypothetical protein